MRPTVFLPAGWRMLASNPAPHTVGEILNTLGSRLGKVSDLPALEAQVLVAHLLDMPRSWVLAHPEVQVGPVPAAQLEKLVIRLEQGEPLPYILRKWEFFGLDFVVTPAVLIPRPETELLVEQAIAWIMKSHIDVKELKVLDVGTGSGCIAITVAVNVPGIAIIATDISPDALEVAHHNAERLGVADRVTFLEADLFPDPLIPNSYSLILANLPYIPTMTLEKLPVYRCEPAQALDGGVDGLTVIRNLLMKAPKVLAPGGSMLLEIEASEGAAAFSLASDVFEQAEIQLHQDLAGYDRLLEVQR
jgi:release factor glutamine methyltransferase